MIIDVQHTDTELIFTHAQHVQPIIDMAAFSRQDSQRGFTQDRSMQKVGSIPMLEWLKHPEWAEDVSLATKWLNTEEGRQYKTAPEMRQTHAGIIVK